MPHDQKMEGKLNSDVVQKATMLKLSLTAKIWWKKFQPDLDLEIWFEVHKNHTLAKIKVW